LLPIFFYHTLAQSLLPLGFRLVVTPPRRAAQKHPDPENLHLLAEAVAMLGDLPQLPTRNKFDRLVPENFDLDEDDEVMLNPSDG